MGYDPLGALEKSTSISSFPLSMSSADGTEAEVAAPSAACAGCGGDTSLMIDR